MRTKVTTYHLEMTDPREFRPSEKRRADLEVRQAEIPCPDLNRFFYEAVGRDWAWIDRMKWTYEKWLRYADRKELKTWYGLVRGTPVGYFELEAQAESNIEIVYFGLLSQFVGRGLGGQLLTAAIEQAWQMNAKRVWVHTCTLDHPSALANYQARGFRIFKEVESEVELPAKS
jgi:GNAT superfamily N-acetyltransferase